MKAEEINKVINHICDKIGVGIDNMSQFVPLLAKYNIVHSLLWAVLLLIAAGTVLVIDRKCYVAYKAADSWDKEDWLIGIVLLSILAAILIAIVAGNVFNVVEWIVAPEVKAIKYVLEFMN